MVGVEKTWALNLMGIVHAKKLQMYRLFGNFCRIGEKLGFTDKRQGVRKKKHAPYFKVVLQSKKKM